MDWSKKSKKRNKCLQDKIILKVDHYWLHCKGLKQNFQVTDFDFEGYSEGNNGNYVENMTLDFTHEFVPIHQITLTRIFDYDLEANKVINYDDENKFTVFIGEGMFGKSLDKFVKENKEKIDEHNEHDYHKLLVEFILKLVDFMEKNRSDFCVY